jgi:hypothetical protein
MTAVTTMLFSNAEDKIQNTGQFALHYGKVAIRISLNQSTELKLEGSQRSNETESFSNEAKFGCQNNLG